VTPPSADNSLLVNIENKSDICSDVISSNVDEVVIGNMLMESTVESEVAQNLSRITFELDSVCISYTKWKINICRRGIVQIIDLHFQIIVLFK
jgi:hypothetical protein